MSVEEKIGQMILAGITGTTMNPDTSNLINQHRVGGIIFYQDNFQTPEQTVQLVNQIKEENQSNLPLFLSTDREG
ncbi:glycoside hydrolase family 3 N-terminal domain-containing protein, partial [Brevibacterium sp. SIMBA_078]|uniref:glycoside hydrolase family 3 N-terminal domain-containing protein n=1 Tax=Brevibacterium sp. SIMBA_078 TaxID=3085816 RepID=UPI0039786A41